MLRLLLIFTAMATLTYCVFIIEKYLRSAYILVFIAMLTWELIYYVNKTNRDLAHFLLSVQNNDFSTHFGSKGKGKSFQLFYDTFNSIFEKLHHISSEKEAQYLHLQRLVEHINVGILSFNTQGQIFLINRALVNLLQIPDTRVRYLGDLERINPFFCETIKNINAGERKLIKISHQNELLQLSVHATEFTLQHHHIKLISAQNIKGELEEKELEAWQKLIRVLTHEIMNSIAPIISLSGTLHSIVQNSQKKDQQLSEKTRHDLERGLDVIKNRSDGLLNFPDTSRNLTQIPKPVFKEMDVKAFCERIHLLFKNELEERKINFHLEFNETQLPILADSQLLEQVMINLLKNAMEAVVEAENPAIHIVVQKTVEDKTTIQIVDNGMGMHEELLDKIFIPFFTTKDQGSGIGLSLCRQIIQLHKGNISVQSKEGEGTVFVISI